MFSLGKPRTASWGSQFSESTVCVGIYWHKDRPVSGLTEVAADERELSEAMGLHRLRCSGPS